MPRARGGEWQMRFVVLASLFCVVMGCGGSSKATLDDGGSVATGGNGGTTPRGTGGSSTGGAAGTDAHDAAVAICDHSLANPACWSSVGLAGKVSNTASWFGGAFDGRYVYVVNSAGDNAPTAIRHDTEAATPAGGWSVSPPGNLNTDAWDYRTAAFDGRYVYLIPSLGSQRALLTATAPIVALQFDTQGTFNSTSAWSQFDLTAATATPGAIPGFLGGAFDGRYVYFIPNNGAAPSGLVMRYDSQASFSAAGSWSTFDTTTVNPLAAGFEGAAFDGRYLYLVPQYNGSQTTGYDADGLVTRYDTKASFSAAGSWSTFDASTVDPHAAGFAGAAFDGRYIYFVPNHGETGFPSIATRYDTQGSFTATASWATFDTGMLHSSGDDPWDFVGATFDGRYVYFAPNGSDTLVRYDSQGSFTAVASWETLQSSSQISLPTCEGAIFDGRYVYLVPSAYQSMMVFDAVASPALSSGAGSSFF